MTVTTLLRYIQWPWALAFAVILPVVTAWLVGWGIRARRERLSRLGTPSMIARLAPSITPQRTWSAASRAAVAALLLGLALAGPRWGVEQNVVKQQGIDVVLALDASLSMLATDEKPSRLQAMKQEIDRLRDLSPGDRFALLAFAGRSYILTPLTVDKRARPLSPESRSVDRWAGGKLARQRATAGDESSRSQQVSGRQGNHPDERWGRLRQS